MTMPTGEPVFVDTNILVYASMSKSPWHRPARNRLLDLGRAGAQIWISRQVLREFLAVTSRPGTLVSPLAASDARSLVELFARKLYVAEDDAQVTDMLLGLIETVGVQGKQVHDANIVATMLRHSIGDLLTHNVSDFIRYAPAINVLPLL